MCGRAQGAWQALNPRLLSNSHACLTIWPKGFTVDENSQGQFTINCSHNERNLNRHIVMIPSDLTAQITEL